MIGAWDQYGKLVSKFNLPSPPGLLERLLRMGYTLAPVKDGDVLWVEMSREMRQKLLLNPPRAKIRALKDLETK